MRFKKLPVEIEVEEQVEEPKEVETPEGFIEADPGDVILRGVEGERYPVKPEIFAKTYVPADPSDMEAFKFYESASPKGVQVLTEEDDGDVRVTGVVVAGQDELDRDEWRRAVEFSRELSRAVGLDTDPPIPPEEEGEVGE